MPSDERATLFEHCARGIDHSLAVGRHGLPLIGGGDWNDGLNRVGAGGQGESIWLGWFLYATIGNFAALPSDEVSLNAPHPGGRMQVCYVRRLSAMVGMGTGIDAAISTMERHSARRRAASAVSTSIAQSWGVISGAADPVRAARAMAAADQNLVSRADGLALLFTPPLRQDSPGAGLHQGLSPGYSREWRAIYPCRDLVGAGAR